MSFLTCRKIYTVNNKSSLEILSMDELVKCLHTISLASTTSRIGNITQIA